MRFTVLTFGVAILFGAPLAIAGPALTLPSVTVGKNLQMNATVTLAQPAADTGLQLTVTSDDPSRLLLSTDPEQAGSAKISVKVNSKFRESREFWLQGLSDHGSATYTVTAEGMETANGVVTLAPSAIVIVGPFKQPTFPTTPRGPAAKITVASVVLNAANKVEKEQQIAGGRQVEVTIANSSPEVGKLGASKLTVAGGSSFAVTQFQATAVGNATLTPVQPAGFTAAAQYANVTFAVALPGLAIVGETYIGKNLQLAGNIALGEMAPAGGVKVTLTSSDPSKLVLAGKEDQVGSASLTVTVPEGKFTAPYFLQALGDSGEVTYEAAAPGFRSRTARLGLAPSGLIVAFSHYGPPDEAMVLRKGALADSREFFVSLAEAKEQKTYLTVYTAYLHPDTGRVADITVQPLRPGATATAILNSSNPEVAGIESPVTIRSGATHANSQFSPKVKGTTVISVQTPSGFASPKNATSVPATVND
jgi:hypothetical protein